MQFAAVSWAQLSCAFSLAEVRKEDTGALQAVRFSLSSRVSRLSSCNCRSKSFTWYCFQGSNGMARLRIQAWSFIARTTAPRPTRSQSGHKEQTKCHIPTQGMLNHPTLTQCKAGKACTSGNAPFPLVIYRHFSL
eukprot:1821170-Amphidinium_carterae.1